MALELKNAQDEAVNAIRAREEAEGKLKNLASDLNNLLPN